MSPDLQRIHVKLLADAPPDLRLDPFLAIFGRWRQDKTHPAQWIDLADYAHMAKGPGILLVGKQGNYSINRDDPGLGLLYSGKTGFEGSEEERVIEAFRRCLELTLAIREEPEYPADLKLEPGSWELFINDRLNFPNNEATDTALKPSIESALDVLFGSGGYTLTRDTDPQRRYAFSIRASAPAELPALLAKVKTTA